MSTIKHPGTAIVSAVVLGVGAVSASAMAGPVTNANGTSVARDAQSNVQHVRDGWGGVGFYIGPGHGYDYGYYEYGPRYRTYYDGGYYYYDDGYYRPYRQNRRWARERFEHPLGRR